MITVDVQLLEKQIVSLLISDLNEDAKTALHNLLGEMRDALYRDSVVVIFSSDYSLAKEKAIERLVEAVHNDKVALSHLVAECNRLIANQAKGARTIN